MIPKPLVKIQSMEELDVHTDWSNDVTSIYTLLIGTLDAIQSGKKASEFQAWLKAPSILPSLEHIYIYDYVRVLAYSSGK